MHELDGLLGGGLPAGTSTLLLGPAGTGKSTIASQFAVAAAERGERTAFFVFDENLGTLRSRSRKIGIPVDPAFRKGLITLQQIDPAELSSGEFAAIVRRSAEGHDATGIPAKLIIVDSLNGYLNAMPEEKYLTAQLHELFSYLGQQGVATILTLTQSGMIGTMSTPVDTTYLADNVILFRYFEAKGFVRRAISVVKKRNGYHERTIRELDVNERGIVIGEPLTEFHGILTGVPTYVGRAGQAHGQDLVPHAGAAIRRPPPTSFERSSCPPPAPTALRCKKCSTRAESHAACCATSRQRAKQCATASARSSSPRRRWWTTPRC